MKTLAAALAVITVVAAGCSGSRETSASSQLIEPAGREVEDATCATVMKGKDYCEVVNRGTVHVRYAYVPALENETSLTLVDRGGPGASLFGATWPSELITSLRHADPHTGLVLLEEPWVSKRPTRSCRTAMRAWHLAFRARQGVKGPAGDLAARCDLASDTSTWGWNGSAYRSAVTAVEDELGRRFDHFVGASFAGVRLSYLRRSWQRVALVSPLPPGVRLDGYSESRQRPLDRLLTECSRCLSSHPIEIDGRSIPVTGFDRVSAMVAAGYLSPSRRAQTHRRLRAGTSAADLRLIGRLSDSALARIGTVDLSPAVLAIWSEQCRATRRPQPGRPRRGFFARYLSPCAFITPDSSAPRRRLADRLCVSLARFDPVVPPQLSRTAYATPTTIFRTYPGAHASVRGLARCLAATTAPEERSLRWHEEH